MFNMNVLVFNLLNNELDNESWLSKALICDIVNKKNYISLHYCPIILSDRFILNLKIRGRHFSQVGLNPK